MTSIGDTLMGMIPTNIFDALSSGTLVAATAFSTTFGFPIVIVAYPECKDSAEFEEAMKNYKKV